MQQTNDATFVPSASVHEPRDFRFFAPPTAIIGDTDIPLEHRGYAASPAALSARRRQFRLMDACEITPARELSPVPMSPGGTRRRNPREVNAAARVVSDRLQARIHDAVDDAERAKLEKCMNAFGSNFAVTELRRLNTC